jgi:hypothetical protein
MSDSAAAQSKINQLEIARKGLLNAALGFDSRPLPLEASERDVAALHVELQRVAGAFRELCEAVLNETQASVAGVSITDDIGLLNDALVDGVFSPLVEAAEAARMNEREFA